MNKFKNACSTLRSMSLIAMITRSSLVLVIATLLCPQLNLPGWAQGRAFFSSSLANAASIIDPEDLQGTWTWYTNPLDDQHKWSGSFTITITEEDKRANGFSGSYGDGSKIEEGRFGHTSLIWRRILRSKDENNQDTQTWTVKKIEVTQNGNIKMWGKWRGAFDKCCDNKGDDF